MTDIIDNKLGKLFPPATVFAGYGILALGLLFMLDSPLIGFVVVLIGGFVSFTRNGTN